MKIRNSTLLIACAAYFSFSSAAAVDEEQQKSIDILTDSQIYTRGLTGFAGHRFVADIEFERILAKRGAENVFLDIIRSKKSTPAALAYSFCGLKKLESDKLDQIKKTLSASEAEVTQMHGDVMRKEALSQLMESIYDNGC